MHWPKGCHHGNEGKFIIIILFINSYIHDPPLQVVLYYFLKHYRWTAQDQHLQKVMFVTMGLKNGCALQFEPLTNSE